MGAKIRCKKCGDILESKYRHDFKMCSCKSCYIDGGNDYCRVGGNKEDYVQICKLNQPTKIKLKYPKKITIIK